MKHLRIHLAWALVALSAGLTAGCAGTQDAIKPLDLQGIKKLAAVTSLSDKALRVVPRMGSTPVPYSGQQYTSPGQGAVGGLIEALIFVAITSAMDKSGMGGDPDLLRQELKDFPAKEEFDREFVRVLSSSFEIVSPKEIAAFGLVAPNTDSGSEDKKINDYSVLRDKLGVDTILEVAFQYGLGAYGSTRPSALISARVTIKKAGEDGILSKRTYFSDDLYKKHYTVDEFMANRAELFKRDFREAAGALATLVATDLGAELSQKDRSYWRDAK